MASLHLSAKFHGLFSQWPVGDAQEGVPSVQTMLSFRGLVALSQGEFSERDLSRMEQVVLKAIDWNLRSAAHDLIEWIDILVTLADVEDTKNVYAGITEQMHGIVSSQYLLRYHPSDLAVAMLMNIMEEHYNDDDIATKMDCIGLEVNDLSEVKESLIDFPV